jgi:hypothetical protein
VTFDALVQQIASGIVSRLAFFVVFAATIASLFK